MEEQTAATPDEGSATEVDSLPNEETKDAEKFVAPEENLVASEVAETAAPSSNAIDSQPSETAPPEETKQPEEIKEPDEIDPFIAKAKDNIQETLEGPELNEFLRAHIKPIREQWDTWSENAKAAYVHMLTAQLLQRKAAATQIGIGNEFKLPKPSANTKLMESLKQSQVKPPRYRPALTMPPNLRPKSRSKTLIS